MFLSWDGKLDYWNHLAFFVCPHFQFFSQLTDFRESLSERYENGDNPNLMYFNLLQSVIKWRTHEFVRKK